MFKLFALTLLAAVMLLPTPISAMDVTPYASLRLALQDLDSDDGSDDALDIEDRFSRVGINATTELTETIMLTGQIEYGLAESGELEQGSDTSLRHAYLEFSGDFGNVRIGSQDALWHRIVRGAYFSDSLDSLRHGAIRDDDLVQYLGQFEDFKLGGELSFEGEEGDDVNHATIGAEYKADQYKLQVALLEDNLGEDNGNLIGIRGWLMLDSWTWSAFWHSATDDFDLYEVSGGNVGAETESCNDQDRDTLGLYGSYRQEVHQYHARIAAFDCDADSAEHSYKFEYVNTITEQARLWASFEKISSDSGVPEPAIAEVGFRYDF